MILSVVDLLRTAAVAVHLLVPAPASAAPVAPEPAHRATEVRRIRAHFDSVLVELDAPALGALTASQRSHRAALLTMLRAYRDAGAFPHNYDFPARPTPYFVDRETGVRCAVAHLLATSGRTDIVHRVAATDNNVWVPALATDTAFTGWLDAQGLTLSEAARIQVPYIMPDPSVQASARDNTAAYSIGSVIALGGTVATSLWTVRGNADGHRGLSSIAGFATSAMSIGLGAAAIGDNTAPRAIGPVALVAGGVSAYLSTRGFLRHRAYRTAQRDAAARTRVATTVSPILPIAGVSGTGLAVRIGF